MPTFKAFAVVQLLEQWFTHLVDIGFTAEMEEGLDAISRDEKEATPFLDAFYHGGTYPGLAGMLKAEIDPKEACTIALSQHQGSPVNIRVGRFGPYLEWRDLRVSLPEDMSPEDVTPKAAEELLSKKAEGPRKLGDDPEGGLPIYAMSGRFGPYVQLGEKSDESKPKMKSLPRGMSEQEVSLEQAVYLLSLPREIGTHPESYEPVVLDLGRFGPYIKCASESRSLKAEDSIFTLTLPRALELLAQEKVGRGGRRITKKTVLKDLGEGLQILDGRYGPYVTDGKKNASLPKGTSAEDMTVESAQTLLSEKKTKRKKKS